MPDSTPEAAAPAAAGSLFTEPRYLQALEASGCISPEQGWMARHLQSADGRVPCYAKLHSWGEFVFDFEIARAYQRHGLDYYPKLVSCVPFTPVPGPRLIGSDDAARMRLALQLREQAAALDCSSTHILYLPPDELALLEGQGWLRRDQRRYVWHNHGYADFEAFLATLSSKRRKNIRRERRLVDGFQIQWRAGSQIDAVQWPRITALYANTYAVRGQDAYLNETCLRAWAAAFGEQMQFCLAHLDGELVAMAFFFRNGNTLFGRHWGADARYDLLHFELCYYQGIDYCLQHDLQHFDAGVQGGHKLLRGFDAELAHSAHWFAHAGFRTAIANLFASERRALAAPASGDED